MKLAIFAFALVGAILALPQDVPQPAGERNASPQDKPQRASERTASPQDKPQQASERIASPQDKPQQESERTASPQDKPQEASDRKEAGGYKTVKSGTSCGRIRTKAECEKAARALGSPDTTASTESTSSWPAGCYTYKGTRLYFNTRLSSTAACNSNTKVCFCTAASAGANSCTDGPDPNRWCSQSNKAFCTRSGSYKQYFADNCKKLCGMCGGATGGGANGCQSDEFQCATGIAKKGQTFSWGPKTYSGGCMPWFFKCDGHLDCVDESDEASC